MTERFTELLVQRLDHLDNREVGEYLISLAREKGLLENIFNSMREGLIDRKSTRLNSSHIPLSRMPSSA